MSFSIPLERPRRSALFTLLLLSLIYAASVDFQPLRAQAPIVNKDRGKEMLTAIKEDLKEYYYDPTFRGLDIEAKFKEAGKMMDGAKSTAQVFGIIAQLLVDFNDSHTYFIPPQLEVKVEYGWRMQMIGDKCYVTEVTEGSDAAAKGLKRRRHLLD